MKKQELEQIPLRFVDFNVSFEFAQNIFVDNNQVVSKSLVASDQESGTKAKMGNSNSNFGGFLRSCSINCTLPTELCFRSFWTVSNQNQEGCRQFQSGSQAADSCL